MEKRLKEKTDALLDQLGGLNRRAYGGVFFFGVIFTFAGALDKIPGIPVEAPTGNPSSSPIVPPLFAVIFGVIGLIAIDLSYLKHLREMKSEIFELLTTTSKSLERKGAELYAVLISVITFETFHAIVLLGVMYIVSATGGVFPHRAPLILVVINCCVATLTFLHYRSNAAAVEAFESLRTTPSTEVAPAQPDTLSKARPPSEGRPPKGG